MGDVRRPIVCPYAGARDTRASDVCPDIDLGIALGMLVSHALHAQQEPSGTPYCAA